MSSTPISGHSGQPDAHGQAALLLAESILHVLVNEEILIVGQAIDAVSTAAEVKGEVAIAAGELSARMRASLVLLKAIRKSLEADA